MTQQHDGSISNSDETDTDKEESKPILVRIVEDDELKPFERKTLAYATWGFGVAVGTLVLFFAQLGVMSDQTKILGTQSIEAVSSAIESERNTREQLRIANGQVRAAQDSVAAIRKQTQEDQRPYIWLSQNDMPQIKLGEKAAWNFHYSDFGKSPAVGVAVRCQVRLWAHKTPEMKDMFAPIHKKGFEYEGLVVPPNDRSNWSTCFSEEDITNDDVKTMTTYDGGAKLTLYFEYFDTGWNKYTSQICMLTRRPNAGSQIMPCPAENKIQ